MQERLGKVIRRQGGIHGIECL